MLILQKKIKIYNYYIVPAKVSAEPGSYHSAAPATHQDITKARLSTLRESSITLF